MKQPAHRRRNVRPMLNWLAWLAVVVATAPTAAQEVPAGEASQASTAAKSAGPTIDQLHVGFDGRYKVGYWTAAEVTLTAGSEPFRGSLSLIVPDNDGIPTRVPAATDGDLQLAAEETCRVPVYFRQGQLGGDVTLELHQAGERRVARTFRAGSTGSLAGVLPSTARLTLNIGDRAGTSRASTQSLIALEDLSSLPDRWYGMEGVQAIILHTSDAQAIENARRATAELEALDLWIKMGGRLILYVGRNAPELLGEGPLARFAPGVFQAIVPLRQSTLLEAYVETSEPLAPGEPLELAVAQLRDVQGQIESYAGNGPRDLPLVVRSAHGFGEVVFVAFDIDQPPIAEWKARPELVDRLLQGRAQSAADRDGDDDMLGAVTTLGFVDLAGQLRAALDQFPSVPLIPFWLVAVLIAGYIACIGPVDYYVVRHLLRRPESTWLTFSLTVLAFTVGAAVGAYRLKGTALRVNQLDIVDYDLESGFARRTSWANVFSPEIATYDVRIEPRQLVGSPGATPQQTSSGALLSWLGLSGSGFGGMDAAAGAGGGIGAASANLPLFSVGYDYNRALDELRGVPIAIWSSKPFVGRNWGEASGGIEAQLADNGQLTGTIRNALGVPLTHSVLIYGKWAYVIRDFAAGQELDLSIDIDPQTVDTYLRKVTAVGDRKVATPYDQAAFDVPRIVELMTAHELVGGKSYTGLENVYQGFVELSGAVDRGRAVLIGRVSDPETKLVRVDGEQAHPLAEQQHSQHWTFHRYVIPVTQK